MARPIRSLHLQSNRYYYIFAYYKRTRLFSLELVLDQRGRSTDLVENVCGKDDKTIGRTDGKQKKRTVLDAKADCSFKFKREAARTLKIYFEKVSDRGNETIVGTIAIVKQVILASKK